MIEDRFIIKYKKFYEFIYRADTIEQCKIARSWLIEHREYFPAVVFKDLIETLGELQTCIYRQQIQKENERLFLHNSHLNDFA